ACPPGAACARGAGAPRPPRPAAAPARRRPSTVDRRPPPLPASPAPPPSPGRARPRSTADGRRSTRPAPPSCPAARPPSGVHLHLLRLLRRVRVVGPGVDLQLAQLRPAEARVGQHALHGRADDLLGPALEHVVQRPGAQPTGVARVAVVALLL